LSQEQTREKDHRIRITFAGGIHTHLLSDRLVFTGNADTPEQEGRQCSNQQQVRSALLADAVVSVFPETLTTLISFKLETKSAIW
jgi:hypothetical protein